MDVLCSLISTVSGCNWHIILPVSHCIRNNFILRYFCCSQPLPTSFLVTSVSLHNPPPFCTWPYEMLGDRTTWNSISSTENLLLWPEKPLPVLPYIQNIFLYILLNTPFIQFWKASSLCILFSSHNNILDLCSLCSLIQEKFEVPLASIILCLQGKWIHLFTIQKLEAGTQKKLVKNSKGNLVQSTSWDTAGILYI